MEHNFETRMDDFLQKGEKFLKNLSIKVNVLITVTLAIILFMATVVVDTRNKVERNVDRVELATMQEKIQQDVSSLEEDIENTYVTKEDAFLVHTLERGYYESRMDALLKDREKIEYPELIPKTFQ